MLTQTVQRRARVNQRLYVPQGYGSPLRLLQPYWTTCVSIFLEDSPVVSVMRPLESRWTNMVFPQPVKATPCQWHS
jgi:hypothetical protein